MSGKIIFGILFSVWTILLILLSLWPAANNIIRQNISEFRWDYLEHFLFYFILGLLYILWRIDQHFYIRVFEFLLFLAGGLIFSWLTEYIQILIPSRAFNPYDMISNMTGIISGTLITYFFIARILFRNWIRKKSARL